MLARVAAEEAESLLDVSVEESNPAKRSRNDSKSEALASKSALIHQPSLPTASPRPVVSLEEYSAEEWKALMKSNTDSAKKNNRKDASWKSR